MIITLTGKKGAGKTTVAKRLAERLDYDYWGVGHAKRELAEQMGLSIQEFDDLSAQKPDKYHRMYDEQTKKAGERDDVVIDGNVAFYFVPHSYKVFLTAEDEVRGKRVFDERRASESGFSDWQEALASMDARLEKFRQEMIKLYGPRCDPLDRSNYDLVLDTSDMTVEQVVDSLYEALKARQS